MKKINFLNILIILALCACGYTPIYKGMNDVNYEIEITNLKGDKLINNVIKFDLKRYEKSGKPNKELYKFDINTKYEKTTISKNLAGANVNYELKVISTINISSTKLTDELIIVEKLNMDNINDEFKENEYENTIKRNFGNSISRKIISKILQTQ
jgi:hypothetical protein|tara:strand:- start:831 stop:1295 length:465 start_codon:yes stop_codon:yes gene_type:complete